jgi:electron transport complex protein RnfE
MNDAKTSKIKVLTNGLLKENPVLRLVLGTCPTLAVTTAVFNGLGMGVAATFVLICSNMAISALRKIIPSQVRLPCFIVIIASFVTVVHMLIRAFVPPLNAALGVYLPLITVNCIILGRAEMFASKNNVAASALDGLGMGVGFTITLVFMSAIREFIGAGSIFGINVFADVIEPIGIMLMPPGGFFVFGCLMALAFFIEKKMGIKPVKDAACGACPSGENCPMSTSENSAIPAEGGN